MNRIILLAWLFTFIVVLSSMPAWTEKDSGMVIQTEGTRVKVNLGTRDGIKPEIVLYVYRDGGLIGKLILIEVDEYYSVGKVEMGAVDVKVGDVVIKAPPKAPAKSELEVEVKQEEHRKVKTLPLRINYNGNDSITQLVEPQLGFQIAIREFQDDREDKSIALETTGYTIFHIKARGRKYETTENLGLVVRDGLAKDFQKAGFSVIKPGKETEKPKTNSGLFLEGNITNFYGEKATSAWLFPLPGTFSKGVIEFEFRLMDTWKEEVLFKKTVKAESRSGGDVIERAANDRLNEAYKKAMAEVFCPEFVDKLKSEIASRKTKIPQPIRN